MWQQDETGRIKTPFEPLILAATLAMIPVLIIERDANSDVWQNFAQVANWLIWAVFALDLIVARRRWAALRAHRLDAAIVVVTTRSTAHCSRRSGSLGAVVTRRYVSRIAPRARPLCQRASS